MVERSDEWWARIAHAFAAHVRGESYALQAYAEAAGTTSDAGTRFLLELILEDEERHHEVFRRLSESVAPDVASRALPGPPSPSGEERTRLTEQVRGFLADERSEAAHLAELHRELRPVERETMWGLLVDLMALDTSKHVRMLGYLLDRLEAAEAAEASG